MSKKRNKKRKMHQKIIKFIVIVLIVLLIIFIGWKSYVFISDYVMLDVTSIKIQDVIEIGHIDNSCNVSDGYINLYIPDEFKINENIDINKYSLNYDTITGKSDAYISFMKSKKTFKENIAADDTDLKRLENNNISDGFDLIKYYYDNQNKSINILSSTNRIKLNKLALRQLKALVTSDKVYMLEGDLEGILCIGEKNYHTILFYVDYYYVVDFYNENIDYFDYNKIVEYLDFITFEI